LTKLIAKTEGKLVGRDMMGVDSAVILEVFEVGGYMLNIYMYNMNEREKELLHHPKMQFGVIQDTPNMLLTVARFGNDG
jgi:hypothetical protein